MEEVRVQFKTDVDEDFWKGVSILFTNDGLTALLVTPFNKYMISFDRNS